MPRRTHSPSTRVERRPRRLSADLYRALALPDPRDVVYELRRDGEHERALELRRALS